MFVLDRKPSYHAKHTRWQWLQRAVAEMLMLCSFIAINKNHYSDLTFFFFFDFSLWDLSDVNELLVISLSRPEAWEERSADLADISEGAVLPACLFLDFNGVSMLLSSGLYTEVKVSWEVPSVPSKLPCLSGVTEGREMLLWTEPEKSTIVMSTDMSHSIVCK